MMYIVIIAGSRSAPGAQMTVSRTPPTWLVGLWVQQLPSAAVQVCFAIHMHQHHLAFGREMTIVSQRRKMKGASMTLAELGLTGVA